MKRFFALLSLTLVCAAAVFADATFRQVMEFKFNVPMPVGAMPGGFPFSGPTEVSARVKGTLAYSSFGKFASIIDSSKNQVILIDTDGKRYAAASMADYLAQIARSTAGAPQMPDAARQILQNMQFKFESHDTGRSEKIQGIDADEKELLFTMTIPIPAPGGNGNGIDITGKFSMWKPKPGEIERVPALREMSSYYEQSRKTGNDAASLMTKMFTAFPGMSDKMSGLVGELQQGGSVMLRLHGEFAMPGMAAMLAQAKAKGAQVPSIPDGPLFEFSSSVKELNTDPVPDSVFQVPEGYQQAPLADVIKAFLPGAGAAAK